jgi:hypothetical protein
MNAGVKTVEVNSFADGDRFLVPLGPVDQWPSDLNGIGHIFKAAIRLSLEFASSDDRYRSGTELKIYCPPIRRNGDLNTAGDMLQEQLATTLKEMGLEEMEFSLQILTRGPEVQL